MSANIPPVNPDPTLTPTPASLPSFAGDWSATLPAPRGHARWKIYVFGAILFLSGGLTGSALTFYGIQTYQKELRNNPDKQAAHASMRLREELGLSQDQVKPLELIFAKRFGAMRQLRQEHLPKMRQQFETMNEEVLAILTPEQQVKWRERYKLLQSKAPFLNEGGPGLRKRNE